MKKPERFAVCMAAMATLALIFAGCSDETEEPDPGIVYDADEWLITDTTAVRYRGTATEVNVPDGVTVIGNAAFNGCTSLESVMIPGSVTFIGENAFEDCGNLKTVAYGGTLAQWCALDAYFLMSYAGQVTMSDGTDLKHMPTLAIPDGARSIGNGAFKNCAALTSVTIPASVVIVGGRAFRGCESLESVTIPASVTSIGSDAFAGCTSLASVTIPASVTSIGNYAFYKCTSLTSVTISASVTSIGSRAFRECTSLTTINYTGTKEQWACMEKGSSIFYATKVSEITDKDGNTFKVDTSGNITESN